MSTDARIVFCTFPDTELAASVGRAVVSDQLAACVNIIPGVRSIYAWESELHDEPEVVALIKTTMAKFEALRARIVALHPYGCPEVVSVEIAAGHAPYLRWIHDATTE